MHFVHKLFFIFIFKWNIRKFDIKLQLNKTVPFNTYFTWFFSRSVYKMHNTIEIHFLKINSLKLFWNDVCTLSFKEWRERKKCIRIRLQPLYNWTSFRKWTSVIKSHWSQSKKKQSNDSWRYIRATIATNDRNQQTNEWKRQSKRTELFREYFCCILTNLHANYRGLL